MQISITATRPRTRRRAPAARTWEDRRPQRGAVLPTTKPIRPEPQRLLQDHPGDGAVAGADELEHRDLADLVQRHGVDDEGHDGGADHREDDQEHADLACRGGDQLGDEDFFHLRAGEHLEVLPAADRRRPRTGSRPSATRTSTALTLWLVLCEASMAASRPGTPGRLRAGLAAVPARPR